MGVFDALGSRLTQEGATKGAGKARHGKPANECKPRNDGGTRPAQRGLGRT